jgi:hypothetical protein
MKLHIITVANKSKYYYPYLVDSVKRNNNSLITLGFNKEWGGFNRKFKLMYEELNKLDDYDIACFVDGFDVICVRDLNELIDAFFEIKEREDCTIVAGRDYIIKNVFRSIISSLYFTKTFNSTVINSGTYIGYVKDIKKFLSFVLSQDDDELADDQILMNTYSKLHPNEIYIDINTELFLTISKPLENIKNFTKIKNNIVYSNNNKPFFIHAAGSGYMNDILEELGYDIDKQIEIDLKNNFNNKNFNQFIKNNIIKILKYIDKYKYDILFGFILFFIISYIFIKSLLISFIKV